MADPIFRGVLTALAVGVLVLMAFFFVELVIKAQPTLAHTGVFNFVFGNNWDFSQGIFKALPLLVGTLVTATIALIIGVPVAIATALYLNELCPQRLRTPLTLLVDLLAAVPSVVFGLWGLLFLAPKLRGVEQWFANLLGFIPVIGGGTVSIGLNFFIAGLVLAIMILPIVSAISREVIATVPLDHKEAALALGATRWEMIRMSVLPYSRAGIAGATMLGLGRAIGEAIAVAYLIGNSDFLITHIVEPGNTLAATIALKFNEAADDPTSRGALIACGLLLFVLTLIANLLARYLVSRATRATRAVPAPTAAPSAVA